MKNTWKWELADHESWSRPAPESYYLLTRWGKKGSKLLDLGCGIGRHALLFASEGFEVSAVDFSDEAINVLRQKSRDHRLLIDVRKGEMTKLPYEDESFDFVISFHVIYHGIRNDVAKALSEVFRIMRPGGEFFVTFNSADSKSLRSSEGIRIDERTIVKAGGIENGVPHYYVDKATLEALLKEFELISLRLVSDYYEDMSSSHYYVLCRKPDAGS